MSRPVNLYIESYYLQGARQMLLRLMESYQIAAKIKMGKDDAIYVRAELDMILSSVENTHHFLAGDLRIHYRNHKRNKAGKLISAEAYLAP